MVKSAARLRIENARPSSRPQPPRVKDDIAGSHKLDSRHVKRLLGPTTWSVWTFLMWCRDKSGVTFVRNTTVATKRELSSDQVLRSVGKLRRVGLVGPRQWMLPFGGGDERKKKGYRRVFGDVRGSIVTVPGKCLKLLSKLTPKGGARAGSGPKSAVQEIASTIVGPQTTDLFKARGDLFKARGAPIQSARCSASSTHSLPNNIKALEPIKAVLDSNIDYDCRSIDLDQINRSTAASDAACPDMISRRKNVVMSAQKSSPPNTDAELDAIAKLLREGGPIVPRYPSRQSMKCAVLPSPPCIPDDLDDVEAAKWVLKAYRGAVGHVLGIESFVLADHRIDVTQTKVWRTIKAGVAMMREMSIPPASWCMFSCEAWKKVGRAKTAPPIEFVFNTKRMVENRGWFGREYAGRGGGTVMFAVEHREVLQRYRAMVQEQRFVLAKVAVDGGGRIEVAKLEEALRMSLARHFPGGYEAWLEAAQAVGESQAVEVKEDVARGEYVWD